MIKLCMAQKLFESNLEYSMRVFKARVMYRHLEEEDIWGIIRQCTMEMILQAPLNASCSYATLCTHEEK